MPVRHMCVLNCLRFWYMLITTLISALHLMPVLTAYSQCPCLTRTILLYWFLKQVIRFLCLLFWISQCNVKLGFHQGISVIFAFYCNSVTVSISHVVFWYEKLKWWALLIKFTVWDQALLQYKNKSLYFTGASIILDVQQ